jgi:hypothetical protein
MNILKLFKNIKKINLKKINYFKSTARQKKKKKPRT